MARRKVTARPIPAQAITASDPIEFPAEDSAWIALQRRTIEIVGKPMEDLKWGDLNLLRASLPTSEVEAIQSYRRRHRREHSAEFDGIKSFKSWKDQRCDWTYESLIDFLDTERAVIVRLTRFSDFSYQAKPYMGILHAFEKKLFEILNEYPGLIHENTANNGGDILERILLNVPRLLPCDDNHDMLSDLCDQLDARGDEIECEKQAAVPVREQKDGLAGKPVPPIDVFLREEFKKRDGELAGKRYRLWDVTRKLPLLKIREVHRVRARDENEAHEIASEILSSGTSNAKPADKKRRRVFYWDEKTRRVRIDQRITPRLDADSETRG